MPTRIVIIGAGFGGYAAARALRRADAQVTVIDRTNHYLFQPLLYQVATAALSPADIATATRALLRRQANTTVLMAEVTGIDTTARQVQLRDTDPVPYDRLVVATGCAYSFFGHDEWAQHAPVLKSLDDATAMRDRLLGAFEWAESHVTPAEAARLLTFVVVGGGPTGVELAGTIAELRRATLSRDFRHIDPARARVVLCEAGDRLLAAFPEPLSRYAAKALESLGVELRLGAQVTAIDADGLTTGGTRIESANVFWAAGTTPRPAAQWLGAETARHGAVKVGPDCSVAGLPGVYAIGDVTSQQGPDGKPLPGLAAVAKQQGAHVGRLLAAEAAGTRPPPPFRYRDLGTLAVIGRSRAVAKFGRVTLTGTPAWLVWSGVHLMLLADFRNRVAVYRTWIWSWLTRGRSARLVSELPRALVTPPQTQAKQ